MNNVELDKRLQQGKDQAGHFFGSFPPVHIQVDRNAVRRRRPAYRPRVWVKAGVAALFAAAGICMFVALGTGVHQVKDIQPQQDNVLAEQTVALNDDKEYRMNYIPTQTEDDAAPGLMTVLWEMYSDGNRKMVYHSLFESCDVVYPAMVIPFPETDNNMLLIASGDSAHDSLGYRLVGYSGDAMQTWWSRDDVPDGVITVSDGVAVEQSADVTEGQATSDRLVTYIVPIQIPGPGSLVMPVESLELGLGEQILLIGSGMEDIDAVSQYGLMSRMEPEETEQFGTSATMFKAVGKGKDILSIGSRETGQALFVVIID